MPWSVSFDADACVVTTVYAGDLSPAALRDAVATTLATCLEHACVTLLADCTQLEGGHSVLDLYDAAVSIGAVPGAARLKEAVLVPSSAAAADTVQFWETAATNRGIHVRLFTNRDDALNWLRTE